MDKGNSRFEWLKEYQQLDRDIAYLKWDIKKTEIECDRWSGGDLANLHVSGEKSRPAKLQDELEQLYKELSWRETAVKELISLVDKFDGVEEQILKKKYIDGESLELVAEELNYSVSYIRQKHAELHRRLDFIDEFNDSKAL